MPVQIPDILRPDAVKVPLDGTSKRAVIDELCDLLECHDGVDSIDQLKQTVWEREDQRSTGIGEGLAIPHGKCRSVSRPAMAIGLPTTPLEFDSIDGRPVELVILLASPADRIAEHIQALGKISRLMSDSSVREKAYHAADAETLYRLFADQVGK